MSKRNKKILLIFMATFFIVVLHDSLKAQILRRHHMKRYHRHRRYQVPEGFIMIQNITDREVLFSLRKKRGEWKSYRLGAEEDDLFPGDEVWIRTSKDRKVHYNLDSEERYEIFWNEDRFDIRRIGIE